MLATQQAGVLCALHKTNEFLTGERWGRHAPAIDRQGRAVDPLRAKAYRFCTQGALIKMAPSLDLSTFREAMQLLHAAADRRSGGRFTNIFDMNDDPCTTLMDIKSVLADAIQAAEARDSRPSSEAHVLRSDFEAAY